LALSDQDLYERTVEVSVTRDSSGQIRIAALGQAVLIVISGPHIGQRTWLGEAPLSIGRSTACGLMLDIDSVSRQHARIEWTGAAHRVLDLGSTNGTFVNEHRVADRMLEDGDRVGIGKVLLKYISGANIEAAYHEEIQRLVRYDGLTGAFNKRHFEESLRGAVSLPPAAQRRLGLIMFDLDHFKSINDTHGHTAGDAVLRQVSEIVQSTLAPDQVFGRVGGEEFAVLWPDADLETTRELAERVRRAIEGTEFAFEGTKIPVTLSLGVAERCPGTEVAEAFIERADTRLYEAKRSGRNRVC
jgi:diguanylate cyclase (GGDEF)-like protein